MAWYWHLKGARGGDGILNRYRKSGIKRHGMGGEQKREGGI